MILYLLSALAFLLALLSKPVAVVVPLIAAAIDWGLLGRRGAAIVALLPWVILAVPIGVVTRLAQPIPDVYAISPPHLRPLVIGDTLAFYVRQVLFPARLALDYGRAPNHIAGNPLNWLWCLVPIAIVAALYLLRRRNRGVVVGCAIFLIALLPVLGIIPFGAQLYSSVSDHYLYLPMVGLALAGAWGASRVSWRSAVAIATPILVALALRTWFQTWHWRDTTTLFGHTLDLNSRSWVARINLGAEALARNDGALAEYHTREAMKLRPDDALLQLNLGIALGQQSRFAEAADALRRAVALKPQEAPCHFYLAEALLQLGDVDSAERHFRETERLAPGNFAVAPQLAKIAAQRHPASAPAH